jgi:eukaryotic-like serine/threonine-protein kinase
VTELYDELTAALAGRYDVERELGRGGMGTVFLARDVALDRPVAIKVLPPDMSAQPVLRERFLRETRTAAGFSHPNIVPVHAVEARDDLLLFVMGFIDGETLTDRVRRAGPLDIGDTVRLVQDVAWALSYAHSRGVVHRDIKPDNIMLDRATSRAVVTDFGIARTEVAHGLTSVGEVIGTPEYMSPEQAAGETVDGRSDLYALGAVGFYALTGAPPFVADSVQALLAMHITRPAPNVATKRPDVPAALAETIEHCLAKDPAQRPATGEAVWQALDAVRASHKEIAPPLRLFYERINQTLRALLVAVIGALALPLLLSDVQHVLELEVFWLVFVYGLLRSAKDETRHIIQMGFGYDRFREAVAALSAERRATRERLLASPAAVRQASRLRRRRLALGAFGIICVVMPGINRAALDGRALTLIGISLVALSLVATVTDLRSRSVLADLQDAIWNGAIGRLCFALAGKGIPVAAGPGDGASAESMAPVWDTVPRDRRKAFAVLAAPLARLDQTVATAAERAAAQRHALAEARATAGAESSGALADRHQTLMLELKTLSDETTRRHRQLIAARANVRIQLLRALAGAGTANDVLAEVNAATALAGQDGAGQS